MSKSWEFCLLFLGKFCVKIVKTRWKWIFLQVASSPESVLNKSRCSESILRHFELTNWEHQPIKTPKPPLNHPLHSPFLRSSTSETEYLLYHKDTWVSIFKVIRSHHWTFQPKFYHKYLFNEGEVSAAASFSQFRDRFIVIYSSRCEMQCSSMAELFSFFSIS
jgi:hypothetical protein